jgi:methionyl aminopeptidase
MIRIKRGEDLRRMRDACRIAAQVLQYMKNLAGPGISTWDLDQEARKKMLSLGATSACYGYRINQRTPSYPAYTCISVNEEVIHGIASMKRVLLDGDLVSLDVVVSYEGMIGDNATTVAIGEVGPEKRKLLETTRECLDRAIAAAINGGRVGDISSAMQTCAEAAGFNVVRDFVGHGVGYSMHEDPQVPCFGRRGTGDRLRPGMTLAIEPMVTAGSPSVEVLSDGWTAVTRDRRPAAHFEHTVLITEDGPEVLTRPEAA